jgi:hypothetical protein
VEYMGESMWMFAYVRGDDSWRSQWTVWGEVQSIHHVQFSPGENLLIPRFSPDFPHTPWGKIMGL